VSENRIKIKSRQKENSYNKPIGLDTRKSKQDKSNCPLIEEVVVKSCDCCCLKIICDGIDGG